jgi:chromosome partitioning protein
MLRLVTSNQRGGDAKTTTTVTLARYLADKGKKVLIIDTDPQGSVAVILGLRSAAQDRSLHNFLIKDYNFSDCIVKVHDNIDLLPSNRQTVETEGTLMGHTARELTFKNVFPRVEDGYQAVLIDVAPSISLLQTCAMLYAEKILIPASMDPLSLQGVVANIETAKILQKLFNIPIRPVAIMPVKVDRRYGLTTTILEALSGISKTVGIPLLPGIRTDGSAMKAASAKQFLADYDKNCKCLMDYTAAFDELSLLLKDELDESAS